MGHTLMRSVLMLSSSRAYSAMRCASASARPRRNTFLQASIRSSAALLAASTLSRTRAAAITQVRLSMPLKGADIPMITISGANLVSWGLPVDALCIGCQCMQCSLCLHTCFRQQLLEAAQVAGQHAQHLLGLTGMPHDVHRRHHLSIPAPHLSVKIVNLLSDNYVQFHTVWVAQHDHVTLQSPGQPTHKVPENRAGICSL